ncbi:MAG: DUF3108 domain-containing protein [Bryobacteraceae bacterium]|nr:DUF3108 domain-containing protein [Bryobacteraceae bacterium]
MQERDFFRTALLALLLLPQPVPSQEGNGSAPKANESRLHYGVEWRLIRAGTAKLTTDGSLTPRSIHLHLQSVGLVNKLFRVDDRYSVNLNAKGCPTDVFLHAEEGNRRRETKIAFDHDAKKLSYLERDLLKNTVVLAKELEIPACAFDIMGALTHLRRQKLEPGQSIQIPVTDGKKIVSARVEALEREDIRTPAGAFKTVRYEAHLFNNVLYARKGRLFVWLTDDERKLPVQIRARLQFHVGTITLQLEKEEKT